MEQWKLEKYWLKSIGIGIANNVGVVNTFHKYC